MKNKCYVGHKTLRKREIACYKQFLFSHSALNSYKSQWPKSISTQGHPPMPLGNKPLENTVGKGEIVRNEQFLLLPLCLPSMPFPPNLKPSSAKPNPPPPPVWNGLKPVA